MKSTWTFDMLLDALHPMPVESSADANVFKKGHSIELIIRNQDDVLSRLGKWGCTRCPSCGP